MASTSNKPTEALEAEIENLKGEVSSLMETLGKLASEGTGEGARLLREARDRASAQASQSVRQVEAKIVERPLISVLAAFGIGLVIGKLLDRR